MRTSRRSPSSSHPVSITLLRACSPLPHFSPHFLFWWTGLSKHLTASRGVCVCHIILVSWLGDLLAARFLQSFILQNCRSYSLTVFQLPLIRDSRNACDSDDIQGLRVGVLH